MACTFLELGNLESDAESLYHDADIYFRKAIVLNPTLKNEAIEEFLGTSEEEESS
jgi:hypothetical protein